MAAPTPLPKARASEKAPAGSPGKSERELAWLLRQRTTHCITYQARKKRRIFTPKKVGKIVCAMVEEAEGQSRFTRVGDHPVETKAQLIEELRAEISACFDLDDRERKAEAQQAAAIASLGLADAVSNFVSENQTMLTVTAGVLGAFLFLPRLLAVLPRFALVLFPAGARVIVTQVPGVLARIRVQQAANASFLRILASVR